MNKYPAIIFKYSSVYDRKHKEFWLKEGKKEKDYPSERKILNYLKKVEKLWRKDEKSILKELSRITELKWKENVIYCYAVGKCKRNFCSPMTIKLYDNPQDFTDVLIHELIHCLFSQNKDRLTKVWKFFNKKYKKESLTTRMHILVYAVHSLIYSKFFSEKRMKKNIRRINFLKDYKRAWEIVKKEGADNIISHFIKRIGKNK